ncbi:MAG: SurA N-terminal domain-containing protein, partial [Vicinamibacterales bacterium]|nr:SurA N-terminal domain-containing protein [Vicinamibacterales bacterium]
MTMLDRMRQHKGWLKWSLALVCLAFVFLYVPSFVQQAPEVTGAMTDVLARVGDEEITVGEFRNIYLQQLQSYQAQSGGEITSEILQSMGIDRQLLQQMVDEYAAYAEAERLGFDVTDAEVRERIVSLPAFQQNGQFVGEAAYSQLLRVQQPPSSPAQFEENVRRALTLERLQAAVTDWITISDDDLQQEYTNRNEQIRVSTIAFRAD